MGLQFNLENNTVRDTHVGMGGKRRASLLYKEVTSHVYPLSMQNSAKRVDEGSRSELSQLGMLWTSGRKSYLRLPDAQEHHVFCITEEEGQFWLM